MKCSLSKLFETANPLMNDQRTVNPDFMGFYATLSLFFESRSEQGSGQVMKGLKTTVI